MTEARNADLHAHWLIRLMNDTHTHALYTQVGLVIYWVSVAALIYSAGDLTALCRDPNAYTVGAV